MSNVRKNPYLVYGVTTVVFTALAWGALALYSELNPIVSYLIAANLSAFLICAMDKGLSQKERLRVPEIVLHLIALLGGSAGLLLGMKLFRHKTQKASFQIIVVVIILIQAVLIRYYIKNHSASFESEDQDTSYP